MSFNIEDTQAQFAKDLLEILPPIIRMKDAQKAWIRMLPTEWLERFEFENEGQPVITQVYLQGVRAVMYSQMNQDMGRLMAKKVVRENGIDPEEYGYRSRARFYDELEKVPWWINGGDGFYYKVDEAGYDEFGAFANELEVQAEAKKAKARTVRTLQQMLADKN